MSEIPALPSARSIMAALPSKPKVAPDNGSALFTKMPFFSAFEKARAINYLQEVVIVRPTIFRRR
jgi:hypothetical protein